MDIAQRARKRASYDRIRAICSKRLNVLTQRPHYTVYNLTKHTKYTVWWNSRAGLWECTCPTNNMTQRCKHVQRVMDREEARVRREETTTTT